MGGIVWSHPLDQVSVPQLPLQACALGGTAHTEGSNRGVLT